MTKESKLSLTLLYSFLIVGGICRSDRVRQAFRRRDLQQLVGRARLGRGLPAAVRCDRRVGMLFVTSAGNDGIDNDHDPFPAFPASFDLPNVVTVAAADLDGGIADFSNVGHTTVDIAAPGVDILSTLPADHFFPDPGWGWLDGTSMASPHVAGVAALLASQNPAFRVSAGVTALTGQGILTASKALPLVGRRHGDRPDRGSPGSPSTRSRRPPMRPAATPSRSAASSGRARSARSSAGRPRPTTPRASGTTRWSSRPTPARGRRPSPARPPGPRHDP